MGQCFAQSRPRVCHALLVGGGEEGGRERERERGKKGEQCNQPEMSNGTASLRIPGKVIKGGWHCGLGSNRLDLTGIAL